LNLQDGVELRGAEYPKHLGFFVCFVWVGVSNSVFYTDKIDRDRHAGNNEHTREFRISGFFFEYYYDTI
jgi:hypothetical protein